MHGGCDAKGAVPASYTGQALPTDPHAARLQDAQKLRLLEVKQQRASLELEVEALRTTALPTSAGGGADTDEAAVAAEIQCA